MQNTRGEVIRDLVDAGMDSKTWTFSTDYETMYPGEYIESLRTDVRTAEEELSGLRYKYNDLEEECERLQTRTVMDFIKEVKQEQADNADLVREAMKTVKAFKDENARLKEQIDMWGRMNRV
jgi:predicted  nucleic acid-binding Zn-ribbon protein